MLILTHQFLVNVGYTDPVYRMIEPSHRLEAEVKIFIQRSQLAYLLKTKN